MFRCDANIAAPNDPKGCLKQDPKMSENVRIVTADAIATRHLYTPVRSNSNHIGLMSNHPAEFSCRMPYGETKNKQKQNIEEDDIFLRLERFPTTFNWGGRCGAAPYQAILSVQTGTAILDLTKSIEKIELAGNCGWGDSGPISKVIVNADTGEISTFPYSTE